MPCAAGPRHHRATVGGQKALISNRCSMVTRSEDGMTRSAAGPRHHKESGTGTPAGTGQDPEGELFDGVLLPVPLSEI